MKTSSDPRHKNRQTLIKSLFSYSFLPRKIKNSQLKQIIVNLETIDTTIKKIAPLFPIEKINKIDLAILRLAVYELEISNKQPPKAIIDEAIELAKEFGADASAGFINGALGNLLKNKKT